MNSHNFKEKFRKAIDFIYIGIRNFPRDIKLLYRYFKVNLLMLYFQLTDQTVSSVFDKTVKKSPDKIAYRFEDQEWSFSKVQQYSHQVANYFQALGYSKGDTIALLMQNRVEYICVWLGLSRIGVITACINYNLRLESLDHCLRTVRAKAIIYGSELAFANTVEFVLGVVLLANYVHTTVLEELHKTNPQSSVQTVPLFKISDTDCLENDLTWRCESPDQLLQSINLSLELKNTSTAAPVVHTDIGFRDIVVNIFTSGTTGLPKAAVINHCRAFTLAMVYLMQGLTPADVIITSIPLYHVQGTFCGSCAVMTFGCTQVLLRKFSASKFWTDCIRYKATVAQYLGEMVRYLCKQPDKPEDTMHQVKFFYGNGVNLEIWKEFSQRFPDTKIHELYGSTEGNCNMVNISGRVGSCGFLPHYLIPFAPWDIVKVDQDTCEIIRDPDTQLAIPCSVGEPGELVGKINKFLPLQDFRGYNDEKETKKKVLNDIWKMGDTAFRSGDLLVRDKYGYLYFLDRLGDTYRWKGENVATSEVEGIICKLCLMKDVVVYGIEIPGTEGKAGMVALNDPDQSIDIKRLSKDIAKHLPSYARPLFLRIIPNMDMTGTFKMQKVQLRNEGFNPNNIKDPIYFLSEYKEYVPLTKELYNDIVTGHIKF